MKFLPRLLVIALLLPLAFSCNNKLTVTADWKDITVVYGLLNQNDSVHYVKITKAFLGEGNALVFAKEPDSSNYPDKLDVRMEEWNGQTLVKTFTFDTVTLTNKEAGDSIFYFPDQLMYRTFGKLNQDCTYKFFIHNKATNKDVTAKTVLVKKFGIEKPLSLGSATFDTAKKNEAKWSSAVNGRRYQLLIRFHYTEMTATDTTQQYADWIVFSGKESISLDGSETMDVLYPGIGFYQNLGNKIPVKSGVSRLAGKVDFIFTVAADDLNTYMEVTAPSTSIVQEKPSFTNITNGIGIFSARYDNTKDTPRSLPLSTVSRETLRTSVYTKDLGFL
jgi:hypothetical protein